MKNSISSELLLIYKDFHNLRFYAELIPPYLLNELYYELEQPLWGLVVQITTNLTNT